MENVCILSGLRIPDGKYSVEHLVPRFWLPVSLQNISYNKYPAIKIFNNIKDIKMPCEWFAQRFDLTYHAYLNWNMKKSDKAIVSRALDRFVTGRVPFNPCQYCILSIMEKERCLGREDLEKYRQRWLYNLSEQERQKIR